MASSEPTTPASEPLSRDVPFAVRNVDLATILSFDPYYAIRHCHLKRVIEMAVAVGY
jgi:hypothetical protein